MLFLNSRDIEACISYVEVMDAIEDAFRIYISGEFYMPERPSVEYKNKTLLYMPCFKADIFGTKILTVFPENTAIKKPAIDGLMLLNNYTTGEPIALMDGKTITAYRTGAVGSVGIRYLAKKDCKTIGIIGAGVQGFHQALYACTARNIETVFIFDAFNKDLSSFADRLKAKLGSAVAVVPCEKVEHLLKESEIVITTTTSKEPVLPNNKEFLLGKCFIGIGSYKPNMREYPEAIWDVVEEVYTDLEFAIEESGDLCQPLEHGTITKDRIKLLGELISMNKDQEKARKKTTFFKSVGMALFDLTVAQLIYRKAMERNIGQIVKL